MSGSARDVYEWENNTKAPAAVTAIGDIEVVEIHLLRERELLLGGGIFLEHSLMMVLLLLWYRRQITAAAALHRVLQSSSCNIYSADGNHLQRFGVREYSSAVTTHRFLLVPLVCALLCVLY